MEPGTYYKRDMQIEIKGQGTYEGVSVAQRQPSYEIIIEPKDDDPDLIIIRSCHREDAYEKGETSFFFFRLGSKKFKYVYTPIPKLETDRVCPLRGDAYHSDKDNSQHSWFFLDFENTEIGYKINAILTCNGTQKAINGVASCQAKIGLIQVVQFPERVMWATALPEGCNEPVHKGENRYEIKLSLGECLYQAKNKEGSLFRLTTIGYEGIQLRRPQ
jgi:hypothetical protein